MMPISTGPFMSCSAQTLLRQNTFRSAPGRIVGQYHRGARIVITHPLRTTKSADRLLHEHRTIGSFTLKLLQLTSLHTRSNNLVPGLPCAHIPDHSRRPRQPASPQKPAHEPYFHYIHPRRLEYMLISLLVTFIPTSLATLALILAADRYRSTGGTLSRRTARTTTIAAAVLVAALALTPIPTLSTADLARWGACGLAIAVALIARHLATPTRPHTEGVEA